MEERIIEYANLSFANLYGILNKSSLTKKNSQYVLFSYSKFKTLFAL